MSTIVLRSVKGSPLTNAEVDSNFTNLNNDKTELGGTYSSGTANGVLFLSSSKVLTTGSALTFDGTNFGVGTSNPAAFGLFAINGASASANINASTGSAALKFYEGSGTGRGSIASLNGSDGLAFLQGTTEGMRLTSTGLGIGTSSPSNKLTVNSGASTTIAQFTSTGSSAFLGLTNSGATTFIGNDSASGNFIIQTPGSGFSTKLTLDSSGNLGLGVTPSAWGALSYTKPIQLGNTGAFIAGFTSSYTSQPRVVVGANSYFDDSADTWKYIQASSEVATQYRQYNGVHSWLTAPSGTAGDAISFTQAMTLDASGRLAVGSTSVTNGTAFGGGGQINVAKLASTGYPCLQISTTTGGGSSIQFTNSDTVNGVIGYNASGGTNEFTINNVLSGPLTFAVNNSEQMRLTSTGLGIGTSSPAFKLHVNGSSSQFALISTTDTTSTTGILFGDSASNTVGRIEYVHSDNGMRFYTNGSTQATLDTSGNLGLGVTPSAWVPSGAGGPILQIQNAAFFGSASTTGVLNNAYYDAGFKYISSDYASWYEQIDSKHAWFTAPSGTAGNAISFTQAMTLTAAGDLGVGTTSPNGRIQAVGAANTDCVLRLNTSTNAYASGVSLVATDSNGARFNFINASYGVVENWYIGGNGVDRTLVFKTDSTERARIDSSGNLLVGRTSAVGKVDIQSANSIQLYINQQTGGSTPILFDFNGSTVGSVSTNGVTVAYNTSSDYRLKTITGPVTNSGDFIDSLNPVEGIWKADGSTFVGLIAHEVQEASRTQVATGVKDGEKMQGMDYSNSELIANMIAELKSLRARVAALESI
jgi:hypothetical protein